MKHCAKFAGKIMDYMEIDIKTAKSLLPDRPQESNKGTFGKVLNIAGCIEYEGAAYW